LDHLQQEVLEGYAHLKIHLRLWTIWLLQVAVVAELLVLLAVVVLVVQELVL
jgi:polyferredoxin